MLLKKPMASAAVDCVDADSGPGLGSAHSRPVSPAIPWNSDFKFKVRKSQSQRGRGKERKRGRGRKGRGTG